ncbi:hypothetical protein SAMN05421774_101384 [Gemmobacter megaterium]|uniref:DUF1109 domain-containing protein n=1 Tax=Gemmobacter megaterium TaxID=1086013 RepID=A0A1N7KER8_9RHOB|nr:DUF1109 domain-containing protein [Gemmobacter megaterium]GGE01741.1 hypothetical protein GCM10011345_03770 [Gemmobacter megaterium]SIS60081.1 hypothetical protein SAMN05421774_101384 [Gemmobacter megaterium]
MRTDELIGLLAQDDSRPRRVPWRVTLAMATGLAGAGLAGLLLLGIRPDLAQAVTVPTTLMKWVLPLLVGGLGVSGALALARPDQDGRGAQTALWIVLGAVLLWFGLAVLSTPAGQVTRAVMGSTARACLLAVTAIGLPPLVAALFMLRDGASVAPHRNGAFAGLAAGGFAAMIYALHCNEDAPQFFLLWYSLGIAILAACGAWLGGRILRW